MRYFFHIHDGTTLRDEDGVEFDTLDEARQQAVKTAGQFISDSANHFWEGRAWRMDVTDAGGGLIFTLSFTGSTS